jgi:hypothetical protein
VYGWHQMVNGRRHLREECRRCGGFIKFAPQREPFVTLADRAASGAAVLDVITMAEDAGVVLTSDGRVADFATAEDRRRAPRRLHELVRQCRADLGRLMGRGPCP